MATHQVSREVVITVDDLKKATKKLLGRNDNSDFTGR